MSTFEFAAVIAIMVWSITTHEVAHAWVADKLGDDTARRMGRITLNPFVHIELMSTVIMPAITFLAFGLLFGGARPVMVNIGRLGKPRRDWALVGAAGPVSNFLIALACTGFMASLLATGFWAPESSGVTVLSLAMFYNIWLGLFNLLPIPPLDGSRVVQFFLRGEMLQMYYQIEKYGLFIIIGILLLFPGALSQVIFPILMPMVLGIARLFGIEAVVGNSIYEALWAS
jgi:Zn-dependent protease